MDSNIRKNFDMAYPFICSIDEPKGSKYFLD